MTFDEVFTRLGRADLDLEQRLLATVEATVEALALPMRDALEAAAVPHSFNALVLAHLLDVDNAQAETLTAELATLSFVEKFPLRGGWNVHKVVRSAVRLKLNRETPERFRLLSARAAQCSYGDDTVNRVEAIYHGLSSDPRNTVAELERTYVAWDRAGLLEAQHMLATVLEELRTFPVEKTAKARAMTFLGWIRLHRYPLDKSEGLAREAIQSLTAAGEPVALADAHLLLGRVLERRGKVKEALKEFRDGRKLLSEAIRSDPASFEVGRVLADAHIFIGRLCKRGKGGREALAEYAEAQRILNGMIARDPDNPVWKRELSVTHSDVGRIYQEQKDFRSALGSFQADRKIAEELAAADPSNPDKKVDLGVSYNNTGRLFMDQNMFAEALREHQADRDIMLGLIAVDASNPDWLRELSVALLGVGDAHRALKNHAEAIESYADCRRILQGLTEIDPGNAEWQRDLSLADQRLGRLYREQQNFPEALAAFERSRVILERMLAQEPDSEDWLRGLSVLLHHMGRTYEAQGDLANALVSYQQDLVIAERLAAMQPDDASRQKDLRDRREAVDRVHAAMPNGGRAA
ncbi:MAG TPA: tetratricopeptide repeat protein [Bryobacteraceae bacterium]